ncbi:MAG: Endonuclease III [Candidatus Moranbacteria bacterium GW2011_GWC2_45_10]|nr:MAG: Endonuclease III [Candidatus Moranbacteria bacterium GW2011_GWC2_45_10]
MEDFSEKKKRAAKISRKLKELFPDAKIALNFKSNWELLVAVILSAQCTDKKVNEVTEKLFKKYRKLEDYTETDIAEFEKDIYQTGFYRAKAKNILATAKIIKEKYRGDVPCEMEKLVELPGVARKTANIVLGNACGVVEGIAVDTHVRRLAIKSGLTSEEKPARGRGTRPGNTDKIEKDLMELFPKSEWNEITYRLIEYGRQICPRRKHDCKDHPLSKIYPKAADIWP